MSVCGSRPIAAIPSLNLPYETPDRSATEVDGGIQTQAGGQGETKHAPGSQEKRRSKETPLRMWKGGGRMGSNNQCFSLRWLWVVRSPGMGCAMGSTEPRPAQPEIPTRKCVEFMAVKYLCWRTIFRLTPAKWIAAGCNGWQTWRGKFGEWVTVKFGNA